MEHIFNSSEEYKDVYKRQAFSFTGHRCGVRKEILHTDGGDRMVVQKVNFNEFFSKFHCLKDFC